MRSLLFLLALVILGAPFSLRAEPPKPAAPTILVPYRLTDTHHVLVRAKINGKGPFSFILDTGAPMMFIANSVGKQLGLKPDKNGWDSIKRLEIEGGVVIPNARARIETPFQLEGMNGLGLVGTELHGIIGFNILARYRLEFDFTQDKMGWTPLNYRPFVPEALMGRGGAPGGLDALGGLMKLMGAFLGKKPEQPVVFRGFWGMELTSNDGKITVKNVLAEGPAATAGLQVGDLVTRIQEKEITASTDLRRLMAGLLQDQTATVTIVRAGQTMEITVTLGDGL